jgi:hypothetical protein
MFVVVTYPRRAMINGVSEAECPHSADCPSSNNFLNVYQPGHQVSLTNEPFWGNPDFILAFGSKNSDIPFYLFNSIQGRRT